MEDLGVASIDGRIYISKLAQSNQHHSLRHLYAIDALYFDASSLADTKLEILSITYNYNDDNDPIEMSECLKQCPNTLKDLTLRKTKITFNEDSGDDLRCSLVMLTMLVDYDFPENEKELCTFVKKICPNMKKISFYNEYKDSSVMDYTNTLTMEWFTFEQSFL